MNLSVSGVTDLPDLGEPAQGKNVAVISLRDPGDPPPEALDGHAGPLLTLAFHDTDGDDLDVPPGAWHLTQVQRFLEREARGHDLHVHCFAGISRSPAVASFALAVVQPDLSDEEIVAAVLAARPQAHPNPYLLALADDPLGRDLCRTWIQETERY